MSQRALEVRITGQIASFRNPLYQGLQVGLPCPPPSTVGGLLAAAVGGWHRVPDTTCFAMSFRAHGHGTDLETFHPLDRRGRRTEATPKDRDYLWGVELTVWLFDDCDTWYRAFRRPRWPLSLGRSQDLVTAHPRHVDLHDVPGRQRHAVLPNETGGEGTMLRLTSAISRDRARSRWDTYRYAPEGSDTTVDTGWSTIDGDAVVPLPPTHPRWADNPDAQCRHLWAKPASGKDGEVPGESLLDHSAATHAQSRAVQRRIGHLDAVPDWFWDAAALAALTHDAGKADSGFQHQIRHPRQRAHVWGQRHEVLSLGTLGVLLPTESEYRRWAAVAVATHHRPLRDQQDARREILTPHLAVEAQPIAERFTVTDDPATLQTMLRWFHDQALHDRLIDAPRGDLDHIRPADVIAGVETLLNEIDRHWGHNAPADTGLALALLQGVVTLADHVASAHGELHTTSPLTDFPARLAERNADRGRSLHPHQLRAQAVAGKHLVLRAPTGSGKTEAGLLWAQGTIEHLANDHGGTPRLFYVLPYLASINAMTDRLRQDLGSEDIGVAHSKSGIYHLHRLADPDQPADDVAARAWEAADATRLHRELVRVTTPYQLLRAAFLGVTESATLLDTANSVFVFDELHAYEPRRLGMILAMMRLWTQKLGSRVGVLSATLPDRATDLIADALGPDQLEPITTLDTAHSRPRHRLHLGTGHLTDPTVIDTIAADLRAGKAVLVVANNVADAITLYTALKQHAPVRPHTGDEESAEDSRAAWLLHSRFEHRDRTRIESEITDWFRTGDDPTSQRPGGLLVATQTAEISLDVDLDLLHTSGAPLDALIQRFGRVNRRGYRAPAPVWVYPPEYRLGRGNTVRADGVYDRDLTHHTLDLLADHDTTLISEATAQDWLNALYSGEWGDAWEYTVRRHMAGFTTEFLDFGYPFEDRAALKDDFFDQFDGIEAICRARVDKCIEQLASAEQRRHGRLLTAEFHIPLPGHHRRHARFDTRLGVYVINGEYDTETGLTAILDDTSYQPGVLL